ncbi:hypothetical protein KIK06_15825 [Nocardiopsis sp. EMB25]|uniref:hypothetical protein n=1 Tax=Nocardiopsis sp. EMB25 TaxID=2835867 RepID=UPI002283E533|nr:hypothetical protein [Nocardiopsis sp. EMB25]MCY9785353.1 hypothetical protein [Nocardiopsis sp. EMB25]
MSLNIRTLTRTFLVALGTLALTVSIAPSASAHSLGSAVSSSAGCNWGSSSYQILDTLALNGNETGTRYGTAYLLWNNGNGENCVVTRRTGSAHGDPGFTAAGLYIQNKAPIEDGDSNWAHYAAVHAPARGQCVRFGGRVDHNGEIAIRISDNYEFCS